MHYELKSFSSINKDMLSSRLENNYYSPGFLEGCCVGRKKEALNLEWNLVKEYREVVHNQVLT